VKNFTSSGGCEEMQRSTAEHAWFDELTMSAHPELSKDAFSAVSAVNVGFFTRSAVAKKHETHENHETKRDLFRVLRVFRAFRGPVLISARPR
jgi:hypothetical protein